MHSPVELMFLLDVIKRVIVRNDCVVANVHIQRARWKSQKRVAVSTALDLEKCSASWRSCTIVHGLLQLKVSSDLMCRALADTAELELLSCMSAVNG